VASQWGAFGDAYLIEITIKTKTQWEFSCGFKSPFTSSNLKINEFHFL
jgi:hypothetical protein